MLLNIRGLTPGKTRGVGLPAWVMRARRRNTGGDQCGDGGRDWLRPHALRIGMYSGVRVSVPHLTLIMRNGGERMT